MFPHELPDGAVLLSDGPDVLITDVMNFYLASDVNTPYLLACRTQWLFMDSYRGCTTCFGRCLFTFAQRFTCIYIFVTV